MFSPPVGALVRSQAPNVSFYTLGDVLNCIEFKGMILFACCKPSIKQDDVMLVL